MNQILVTEKIYVTPELKRKKKMYKMLFVISKISDYQENLYRKVSLFLQY